MFPIIFGFAAALTFDALAFATYGSVALTDYAWVDMVSWGLVAGGVAVYSLTRPMPAWLCRLGSNTRVLLQARLGLWDAEPISA
jgi:hypothetical protein